MMRRPKLVVWGCLGALLLCGLTLGCTSSRQSGEEKKDPTATVDVLMLRYGDDPDTLNLILSSDTVSEAFQREVYEPMAERDNSNPDEWKPVLAEKWEFDEKNLTYTIHLRKGVYWHPMSLPNGTELPKTEFTSRDVLFTFDAILNENTEAATLRSYFENPNAKSADDKYKIAVKAIDDYTVEVKWSEPYFQAMEFTLGIAIMPRHVYGVDANGEPITLDFRGSKEFATAFNNHWANSKMCGTGPLIFKEWKKEQYATLERNDDYWAKKYNFSKVRYEHIANENTALQKLMQNELDACSIPEKDLYISAQKYQPVLEGKVKLNDYFYPAYRYLGFNLKRELFQDVNVRKAVAYAIPIDDIIEKVYHKLAVRITGPFLPGGSESDNSLKPIPYDLEKARALLEEAGWKDTNQDGIRDKVVAGKRVEAKFDLIIYSDSQQFLQIAELIKENCQKVGVHVQITPTKWALMLQKLRKKEFDACILGWAMSWKSDPYQIWHGSQAELPESSNSIGYNNPRVNELIEKLRVTMDEKAQQPLYHEIHQILYAEQPYVFLLADKATAGYDARIENINYYKIRPCVDTREWTSSSPRLEAR